MHLGQRGFCWPSTMFEPHVPWNGLCSMLKHAHINKKEGAWQSCGRQRAVFASPTLFRCNENLRVSRHCLSPCCRVLDQCIRGQATRSRTSSRAAGGASPASASEMESKVVGSPAHNIPCIAEAHVGEVFHARVERPRPPLSGSLSNHPSCRSSPSFRKDDGCFTKLPIKKTNTRQQPCGILFFKNNTMAKNRIAHANQEWERPTDQQSQLHNPDRHNSAHGSLVWSSFVFAHPKSTSHIHFCLRSCSRTCQFAQLSENQGVVETSHVGVFTTSSSGLSPQAHTCNRIWSFRRRAAKSCQADECDQQ